MNCFYCHHEGYLSQNPQQELTLKQIDQINFIVKKYQIESVKITGGEPLLHPDILEIIKKIASTDTLKDLSMVTNGLLLETKAQDLKLAGLDRINIGLDSLCNSSVKIIDRIEKGIKSVREVGFDLIKLNMVLLRTINDQEINEMMEFAKENNFILQIIELINTNDEFYQKYHIDLDEIERKVAKKAIKTISRKFQDRKQYHLEDGTIIEIVRPMHNPQFCMNCHTLRITHDFKFQPCLNRMDNLVPIKEDIEDALIEVMKRRMPYNVPEKCIND